MEKSRRRHLFLFVTVLSLIGLLYVPRIADVGLFMDGSIYGTVAHNMAIGDGGFWRPVFHNHYALKVPRDSVVFYEHPPLMFWLESLFFRVFGDGFYVEHLYGTMVLVLHILVLMFFFRELTGRRYPVYAVWPVILMWYWVPSILWSFPENMLDNTLSLFTLVAVWWVWRAISREQILWALLAGLMTGLGFLVKGPPALFPLAAPLLYGLTTRHMRFRKMAGYTAAMLAGLAIMGIWIVSVAPARDFMSRYWYQQVAASVAGEKEMANSISTRLIFLKNVVLELGPVYGAALLLWVISHWRKPPFSSVVKSGKAPAVWLLWVGLSAVLPLMVSAKLHTFYLISSVPYFALATGLYWIEWINGKIESINFLPQGGAWWGIPMVMFALSLGICIRNWGKYKRDGDVLHDLELLAQKVKPEATVGISGQWQKHATFQSNLERYHRIFVRPAGVQVPVNVLRWPADSLLADSLQGAGFRALPGEWKLLRVFVKE